MGIECLTKYINEHCKSCYYKKPLHFLRNKVIVVDISIYLYKFKQSGNLIEKLYLMCSKFRQHNIIAIFVFDGKADTNKKECLQERRNERKKYKEEYDKLQEKLKDNYLDENTMQQLKELERKLISITKKDIETALTLFDIMGFQCIQSAYESDIMLASLMYNYPKIWGCMTEDSDLFAYGCKRIIKYFNPYKATITIYNTDSILFNMNIQWKEFHLICLLAKNDYHIKSNYNFYQALHQYKKYKRTQYVTNVTNVYKVFDLPENPYNKECNIPNILYYNKEIIPNSLATFLKPHNFIFV